MSRIVYVLAGLFGLIAPLCAADKPCEMKLYASLDAEFDEAGAVLLPVTINGQEVWMILALNQGLPVLFADAAEDLKLKTRHADRDLTVRGTPVDRMTTVKNVSVGRATFTDWDVYVIPARRTGDFMRGGKPIVGALTSRFFQVVDLELNLAKKKVNLFTQTRCKGGALYWGGEFTAVRLYSDSTGLLIFPMEIDGQVVETSFNTSSRYSRINTKVTKRYFGFDETSPNIEKESVGDSEVSSYRAMALTAKGLEIRNSRILLHSSGGCEPTKAPMNSTRRTAGIGCGEWINNTPFSIGTDLLKKLRVYIGSSEEMVYFTRVEPVAPASTGATPSVQQSR